ncbi:hypothetical protein GCM10010472_41080 [Pseudonocardia halophobica]|uniref:Uncharacterized protein n=1 Tax=Pseudonocardia halophobica TaxID=29401 RepID=A0A9W6L3J3_9PSEU|nr:hypothetical protein [Pseudonocardia halophobica]GLL12423.1 hypothetical protein GCM10017577_35640 [Pseudonocardia halophobica]
MGVPRLSLGEPATVWADEPSAPFQIALAGVFDAGPLRRTDGTVDTERVRAEPARRAQQVPALRRRVVVPGRGRGGRSGSTTPIRKPERQIGVVSLPPGEEFLSWSARQIVRHLGVCGALWRAEVVDGLGEEPLRPLAPLLRHHLQRTWTRNLDAVRAQLDDRETGDDHASRSGVRKPVRQHP